MKKFVSAVIIILAISLISTGYICNGKVLVVENLGNGTKHEFYLPDDSFSLGYIHSIMLTPCEEFFTASITDNICLEKTIYESYGVGLPFLPEEGTFELEDGKFVLKMQRTFQEINMALSPIPKHWLSVDGKKYDLIDLVKEPNAKIKFYITDKVVLKKH